MTTERPAILCIAVGDGYIERWGFCIQSHRDYAARYGYEYILKTTPAGKLSPTWSKWGYSKDILGTRHLMIIDADAEFQPHAPPFTEVFAAHPGRDIFCVLGFSNRPNAGMMIFREGSELAKKFADTCLFWRRWPVPKKDRARPGGDNGHVIWILKRKIFAATLYLLDKTWNETRPEFGAQAHIWHFTNLSDKEGKKRCAEWLARKKA